MEHMFPKLIVHDLEELDLQVKVADGRTLPYTVKPAVAVTSIKRDPP